MCVRADENAAEAAGEEEEEDGRQDDLSVYGYECRLFRDDAMAAQVDAGGRLVPWQGDDGLRLDR